LRILPFPFSLAARGHVARISDNHRVFPQKKHAVGQVGIRLVEKNNGTLLQTSSHGRNWVIQLNILHSDLWKNGDPSN